MALFFPRGQRKQICSLAGGVGAPVWSLTVQETCWAGLRYPAAAGEYAGVRLHVGSTSVLVFREDEFFTCACFSTCVTARPAGILGGLARSGAGTGQRQVSQRDSYRSCLGSRHEGTLRLLLLCVQRDLAAFGSQGLCLKSLTSGCCVWMKIETPEDN